MKRATTNLFFSVIFSFIVSCGNFSEPNPVMPAASIKTEFGTQIAIAEYGAPPLFVLPTISDSAKNITIIPFGQPLTALSGKLGQTVDLSNNSRYIFMANVQRSFVSGTDTFVVLFKDATLQSSTQIQVFSARAVTTNGRIGYMSTYTDMVKQYGCKPDFSTGNLMGYDKWGIYFLFNTFMAPMRVEGIMVDIPNKGYLPHRFGKIWLTDSIDADHDGYLNSVKVNFVLNMINDTGKVRFYIMTKKDQDSVFKQFLYTGPCLVAGTSSGNTFSFSIPKTYVLNKGNLTVRLYVENPCGLDVMDTILKPIQFESAAEDTDTTVVLIDTVHTDTANILGMRRIRAKNQSFTMGQDTLYGPAHQVSFTYDYFIDTSVVTQADFKALMNNVNPSQTKGDKYPVINVTFYDDVLYCNARSKREHRDTVYTYTSMNGIPGDSATLFGFGVNYSRNGYRLPTEAEWEYACRAGTTTPCYWGSDNSALYAWDSTNSNGMLHPVAQKRPNNFGLYDMVGNVYQATGDWAASYTTSALIDPVGPASGTHHIIRGCTWNSTGTLLYSAARVYMLMTNYRSLRTGFRVVLPVR